MSQKVSEWRPSEGESPLDSIFNPDYAPLPPGKPAFITVLKNTVIPVEAGINVLRSCLRGNDGTAIFYFFSGLLKSRFIPLR